MSSTKKMRKAEKIHKRTIGRIRQFSSGMDVRKIDRAAENRDEIMVKVSKALSELDQFSGSDDLGSEKNVLEVLSSIYEQMVVNESKRSKATSQAEQKEKEGLQNLSSQIEQYFSEDPGSITAELQETILDYRLIVERITHMATAVDTYADSIVSPDGLSDFSNSIFSVSYSDNRGSDERRQLIISRVRELHEKYGITTSFVKKIVKESLTDGSKYIIAIPIRKALLEKALVSEFKKNTGRGEEITVLRDNLSLNFIGDCEDRNDLLSGNKTELYHPIGHEAFEIIKDSELPSMSDRFVPLYEKDTMGKKEVGLIDSHIKAIDLSITDYLKDNLLISKSFLPQVMSDIVTDAMFAPEEDENGELSVMHDFFGSAKKANQRSARQSTAFKKKLKKGILETIQTSATKLITVNGENMVPLVRDDKCYGYIYIEEVPYAASQKETNSNPLKQVQTSSSELKKIIKKLRRDAGSETNASKVDMVIQQIFHKKLIKLLNVDVLRQFPEFSDHFYSAIRVQDLIDKKIRVSYFPPTQVVEFNSFDSILKPIRFMAKWYLVILASDIVYRLTRAPTKRVFYLDCDEEDADVEKSVTSFIRNYRTADIPFKTMDQGSVSVAMAQIGMFQDLFIPTVGGEKPIDIELIEDNSRQMDTEFEEKLLKNCAAGLKLPMNWLEDSEQELATKLIQQNYRFANTIAPYRADQAESWSKLTRILYANEFLHSSKFHARAEANEKGVFELKVSSAPIEKKGQDEFAIDLPKLSVSFPRPVSLGVRNISELIDQLNGLSTTMIETFFDDDSQRSKEATNFKKFIMAHLTPGFPWDEFEKMYRASLVEGTESKGEDEDGMSGGYGM